MVGVCSGFLRIQLPRALYGGTQKYISLGLADTPQNRKVAEAKAKEIEADIVFERFDFTFEKYTGKKRHLQAVPDLLADNQPPSKPKLKVRELWEQWLVHKKPLVKETTFAVIYVRQYSNMLESVAHLEITAKTAQEIYQHVISTSINITIVFNLLSQLSQAYDRAIKLDLVDGKNHFYGMAEESKKIKKVKTTVTKADDVDDDCRAFTLEEAKVILNYVKQHHPHYHGFLSFLFMTGCRPGEAIALRWSHVKSDFSAIYFCERYYQGTKTTNSTKQSKDGVGRWFPCYSELVELLKSIKPVEAKDDDLVFKSPTGKQVDWDNWNDMWRGRTRKLKSHPDGKWYPGFVTKLVEQGKLRQYLKPYATRHTFITLQVDGGEDAMNIAEWVGTSATQIWEHYYQKQHDRVPLSVKLSD